MTWVAPDIGWALAPPAPPLRPQPALGLQAGDLDFSVRQLAVVRVAARRRLPLRGNMRGQSSRRQPGDAGDLLDDADMRPVSRDGAMSGAPAHFMEMGAPVGRVRAPTPRSEAKAKAKAKAKARAAPQAEAAPKARAQAKARAQPKAGDAGPPRQRRRVSGQLPPVAPSIGCSKPQ